METNNNNNNQGNEVQNAAPVMSKEDFLASLAERGLEQKQDSFNYSPKESQKDAPKEEKKSETQIAIDKNREFNESLNDKPEVDAPAVEQPVLEEKPEEVTPAAPSSMNIDLKATYKIKVDGKEIEISGAEMQSRASAEIAIEKRFLDIDKAKKEWQASIQAQKDADIKRIQEGDLYGVLSEKFDIPVYALKEKLLKELSPTFVRRMNMTEEQIQVERIAAEKKHYKDSYESELNRRQEEQKAEALNRIKAEEDALNQEILEVKKSNNISDDEWSKAFTALDKSLPQDQEIEVNMVAEYVLKNMRAEQKPDFSQIAAKAVEPYKAHVNPEFMQKLEDYLKITPDLSEDEINKIVKASVQQGLRMQLVGDENLGKDKVESKQEKLDRLKEEALAKAIGTRDTSKNWF